MSGPKILQARWNDPPWKELAERINRELSKRLPSSFAAELERLPLADEVPGFLDLRGAPLTGSPFRQKWKDVDFSYGRTEIWVPIGGGNEQMQGPFGVTECEFLHCRFIKTSIDLSGANRFVDCDLTGAGFDGATIVDCEFEGCNLTDANFRKSIILDCKFVDCVFGGAMFGNASLTGSDISGSDFRGIKVNRATIFRELSTSSKTHFDPSTLAAVKADEELLKRYAH